MTDRDHWPLAGRVAGLVARTYPLAESYHSEHLAGHLDGIVRRANALVAEETRLAVPGDAAVVVVDRREWSERNLASFSKLIEPAERRLAERLDAVADSERARAVARRVVAAETGAVLGVLARRVLGQYELVVPTGEDGDSIAFVGANVLQLERAHQLRPADFRMWIALHECAHRAQFLGVPWMRDYFFGLVTEMVEAAVPEEGRMGRILDEARSARRQGRPVIDERGLLGLLANEGQRRSLDRVQALMSLLEGHGHVVMDRLGERVIKTQARMAALLKARRSDAKSAAFFKLTGLELKIRQYEMGERFVLAVERQAGWDALDHAWSGPDALPTLSEIDDPGRWLRRVA